MRLRLKSNAQNLAGRGEVPSKEPQLANIFKIKVTKQYHIACITCPVKEIIY